MFTIQEFNARICQGGSSGGGGAGGGGSVPIYQYSGTPQADANAQTATSNLYNNSQGQLIYNQAQGSIGGIPQNNTGYNPANVTQQGINVQDAAAGLPIMASQIYQTGFDPQQALFQSMQQQVTDPTNAQLANQGLTGSPFAAGIMGQNLSNLDIGWQNNLLNRELQAVQGAEGAIGQLGKSQSESAALQQAGPQSQMAASDFLSKLNTTNLDQAQQAIGDWLNYLSGATTAAGTAASEQMSLNQQSLDAQKANMAQQMGLLSMGTNLLTGGLGGLAGKG